MNTEQAQEQWQIETEGQVRDTSFAELTSWIEGRTLQRGDRVRKGNLRWIEAGRVPSLVSVFNAVEHGQPVPPVISTTKLEPTRLAPQNSVSRNIAAPQEVAERVCSVHADALADFVCGTCHSEFCRACPNLYGGTVKICPFCGAMCSPIAAPLVNAAGRPIPNAPADTSFGFGDFARALAHPFKFKVSLIVGALMYMAFSVGQSAVSFGGYVLMGSALFCFLLANMLTVGILTNTVENFTQGRLDANFMPSFDDFNVWDDIVHPFFLSIGVYVVSFGPLIVVGIIAIFMMMNSAPTALNGIKSDASRIVDPGLPYAANAAKQSERVREILKKNADEQQRRVAAMNDANVDASKVEEREAIVDADKLNADNLEEMQRMIGQQRKAQLESALGKTPETVAAERTQFLKSLVGYGAVFLIVGGIAILWGLLYFPAACAVAGYTRSFTATMNPLVGLDTIKRLGTSYILILVMGLLLAIAATLVSGVLSVIFSPFDLPSMGNLPAKAIGSLFGFYLSVVFSCIIGYALYKAADRLKLAR
ncbi:MAG TPA: hypothetical protein PLP07_10235 [Pyrinomonadaceae bacterium]|nr:hypothetical protein [Pyrinomonadaceae bacterium]